MRPMSALSPSQTPNAKPTTWPPSTASRTPSDGSKPGQIATVARNWSALRVMSYPSAIRQASVMAATAS
jgi:hypothetical protein